MPRTTKPDSYPLAYQEVIQSCGLQGQTLRLPKEGRMPAANGLSGQERLRKLRAHFYSFIGALKRSTDEKWKELIPAASQTTVYLDKNEDCLIFSNRNKSWQAEAFKMAGPVEGGEGIPGVTIEPVARSLANVMKLLEEGEGP